MARRGAGEGTIHYREDDKRWVAAIRVGGRRTWFSAKTRAAVQAKLERAKRELREGGPLGRGAKLDAYLARWVAEIVVADNTRRRYTQVVDQYLSQLGNPRLSQLTVDAVQRLVDRVAREGKVRSAIHVRAVLSAALNDAVRRELVGRNVAQLSEPPTIRAREPAWLDEARARRFLDAAEGHPWVACFQLSIGLGMRPSEVLGLRWEDVDLDAGLARVRVQLAWRAGKPTLRPLKTERSRRTLPLPSGVVESLRAHRARQAAERLQARRWQDHGMVFTDEAGQPLRQDRVRDHYYRLLERAGLPRIRLYDATRHSFASILAAEGVHPSEIQKIMGHADIQTTLRVYTHVAPGQSTAAARAMERVLGPQPKSQPSRRQPGVKGPSVGNTESVP